MTSELEPVPASHPHEHFQIQVDGKEYRVEAAQLSGLQIKELAGIAAGDQLFERQGGTDTTIYNDTEVTMRNGLRFHHLPGSITAG